MRSSTSLVVFNQVVKRQESDRGEGGSRGRVETEYSLCSFLSSFLSFSPSPTPVLPSSVVLWVSVSFTTESSSHRPVWRRETCCLSTVKKGYSSVGILCYYIKESLKTILSQFDRRNLK